MSKKQRETNGTNAKEKKKETDQKTNRGEGGTVEERKFGGRARFQEERISMRPITMLSPPFPPPSLSLSPPRHDKNRRQVKRRDGSARLLRRSALKVPFAYRAKTRREEKKMRMRFARRRLGREKAMVIEEAGGERGGRKGKATAKRSKSREGKFRYCLRQPRGTQRLKRR